MQEVEHVIKELPFHESNSSRWLNWENKWNVWRADNSKIVLNHWAEQENRSFRFFFSEVFSNIDTITPQG